MASPLTEAHILAQARLRRLTTQQVERIWNSLPGYDRANVDEWLSGVVPLVQSAQRSSVALTEGYLARFLQRRPNGVDPEALIGAAARGGTDPATAYKRPFVTLWTALGSGVIYDDAVSSALARATEMAEFDVQASMRATSNAVQDAEEGFYGYQRVADGAACEFCASIDGAYVKRADAMPLHPRCGCGLEPLTAPHSLATNLPSGVAVHDHGEMGPVLGAPQHDFTSQADLI